MNGQIEETVKSATKQVASFFVPGTISNIALSPTMSHHAATISLNGDRYANPF